MNRVHAQHARTLVSVALVSAVAAGTVDAQTRDVNLGALNGRKLVLSPGDVRTIGDATNVRIRSDQYVLARWAAQDLPTTPVQSKEGQAWAVGYGFIGFTREGQEIRFRPIIETAGGLRVAQDADSFLGQVFVGLVDLRNPSAAYDLPRPVSLLLTGQVDSVSPRQLEITHTNLPFAEVTLGARDPRDQLELQLQASGTEERATESRVSVRRCRAG